MVIKSAPEPGGLLLDTHIFFEMVTGEKQSRIQDEINQAAKLGHLFVSPITYWEIGMLAVRNRIQLFCPAKEWVEKSQEIIGLQELPFTPTIAIEASNLPGNFRSDPADELLVASAWLNQLTLVTRDRKILSYAKQGFISVLEA